MTILTPENHRESAPPVRSRRRVSAAFAFDCHVARHGWASLRLSRRVWAFGRRFVSLQCLQSRPLRCLAIQTHTERPCRQ